MLLVLLIAGAVGWYYSGQILGPDAPPPIDEVAVLAATDTSVTVTPDPDGDVLAIGTSTLEWPDGWGEMTEHLAREGDRVTRRFRAYEGRPPVGGRAGARPFPFSANPGTLLGLPFDSVSIATPVGACPAWVVRANPEAASKQLAGAAAPADSAWVIFVHGRGSVRAQSLRLTPAVHELGWNVLAISYRNDEGAARSSDGRYRLGATEWQDLEAAVQWAISVRHARRVVLVGYSMGGLITLEFLRHSPFANLVEGAILDSPVLRWRPVFDLAARRRKVHPVLTTLGMFVTANRAQIRWEELDQIAHAGDLPRVPVLIIQGSGDATTPPVLADSLAERLGPRATLVRVLDAGHVRGWNVDPRGYEATVASWLGRLGRE